MKAIYISNEKFRTIDLLEGTKDDSLTFLMLENSLMESHIIYFSAGDAVIKEILINKDPFFSV